MKICKNTMYYVRIMGKPYSFGRASRDMLAAQITLDRARRMYPGENWGIVALAP